MVRIVDNYILYEIIGQGEYGTVYRGINKLDKQQYAVKVIEIKKFQKDPKLEQYTANQINILSNMEKNPHIIGYYDMIKSTNNFYFVYEYCDGGTLQDRLSKDKFIEQKEALLIFRDLLEAFKVLQRYNVMHRDLKPDNIFFNQGVTKIGDFGFCKNIQKTKMATTMLGSPLYMAPQVLRGEVYSSKADIWSIGVVLYEMIYGVCPFESSTISQLIQILDERQVQFPQNSQNSPSLSKKTKNLIRKLLIKDAKKRIQWSQLFNINISEDGTIIESKQTKEEKISQFYPRSQKLIQTITQTDSPQSQTEFKKFKRQPIITTRQRFVETMEKNNESSKTARQKNNLIVSRQVANLKQDKKQPTNNYISTPDIGFLHKLKKAKSQQQAIKFIPKSFKS